MHRETWPDFSFLERQLVDPERTLGSQVRASSSGSGRRCGSLTEVVETELQVEDSGSITKWELMVLANGLGV